MNKLYIAKTDVKYLNKVNLLPEYRRAKIERVIHEKDKAQSAAAGLLLEKFFSGKKIEIGQYGKPFIQGDLQFNLAHSGDYVALAVGESPVGCDMEKLRNIDFLRLSKLVFCENEIELLKNCGDAESLFFELWTKKEAFIKCTGEGFHCPPKSLDFSLRNDIFNFGGKDYYFKEYMLDGYKIMLCSENGSFAENIEFADL